MKDVATIYITNIYFIVTKIEYYIVQKMFIFRNKISYFVDIPVFGVMCKVDKVKLEEEEFKEREKKFIGCLGLIGSEHRYTRLVNYCNDVDEDKKRMDAVFPELDVPALKFLRQVCIVFIKPDNTDNYLSLTD